MQKLTKASVILLIIGGVFLWNTWVFGWLNHGVAGYSSMSISELNVSGQPYALFFSITEVLSGLFLLVSAIGLMVTTHSRSVLFLILALIGLIGALTIFDAVRPVDCNRYMNPACSAKIATGEISTSDKQHGVESKVSDAMTILLALVVLAWAITQKMPPADIIIVAAIAIGVIASLLIHSDSLAVSSINQRAWNTLVSFDFLFVAYTLHRPASLEQK